MAVRCIVGLLGEKVPVSATPRGGWPDVPWMRQEGCRWTGPGAASGEASSHPLTTPGA